MKLLAFDTSTAACSVALLVDGEITTSHQVQPMQQGRLILPAIRTLLEAASLSFRDLDAVAYGSGPGSFTGVRIASSVAQGIGFAATRPLIPISSLAAMAQAAYLTHQWKASLVAVDARVNHVYWAQYVVNNDDCVELVGQEVVCEPNAVPVPSLQIAWAGYGDGWDKYGEVISERVRCAARPIIMATLPIAEAMLVLASVKLKRGEWVSPTEALPVYLR